MNEGNLDKLLNKAQKKLYTRVMESIQKGVIPWDRPWKSVQKPFNPITGALYQNTNEVYLTMTANVMGFNDPRWMTFKQAKSKGYSITKGSVATSISYVTLFNKELNKFLSAEDFAGLSQDEVNKLRSESDIKIRTYDVFNANQIKGIEPYVTAENEVIRFDNILARDYVSTFIDKINLRVENLEQDRAFYSPSDDRITLPLMKQFKNENYYYGTLFHELAHATGHKSRMRRNISNSFGNEAYALEELNAELASLLLSSDIGFEKEQKEVENIASYISGWYDVLNEEPNLLFKAIQTAVAIKKYMHENTGFDKLLESKRIRDLIPETLRGKKIAVEGSPGIGKTKLAEEIAKHYGAVLLNDPIDNDYSSKLTNGLGSDENSELDLFRNRVEQLKRANESNLLSVSDYDIHRTLFYSHFTLPEEYEFFQNQFKYSVNEDILSDLILLIEEDFDVEKNVDVIDSKALSKYRVFSDFVINKKTKIVRVPTASVNHENLENIFELIDNHFKNSTEKKKNANQHSKSINRDLLVRDVLITDYARDQLGLTVDRVGKSFTLKEHDSVRISETTNMYNRFSNNKGGSILDFVMEFEKVDFKEALIRIESYYLENKPSPRKRVEVERNRTFELPEAAKDNNLVIQYLTTHRQISPGIVQELITRDLLYQDHLNNCVFVGKYNDKPISAMRRSSKHSSSFKGDVANSNKAAGFYVGYNSNCLVVCEAAIDVASIMTLKNDYDSYDYLSINGVGNAKNAIDFHLKKRIEDGNYNRIIAAFDNDRAGEDAAVELLEHLKVEYPSIQVSYQFPSEGSKDWNDELVNLSKKCELPSPTFNAKQVLEV